MGNPPKSTTQWYPYGFHQEMSGDEITCPEMGCNKGWIALFVTIEKCLICNGTGKIKKKK